MAKGTEMVKSGGQAVAGRTVYGDKLEAIERVVAECQLTELDAQGRFGRAFTLARGMKQLRQLITDEMLTEVMELQGSALGFRTDKDGSGGYPAAVVKECLIEATLRGVFPVGNEFNVISGRAYITKEGMGRLVREFPGFANLKLMPGVPRNVGGGAIVPYRATWTLGGVPDAIEREIPIRVNSGMGADAILGKAERKILAAIFRQLTGSEHSIPEGEVGDEPIDVQASPAGEAPKSLNDMASEAKGHPAASLFAADEPGSSEASNS